MGFARLLIVIAVTGFAIHWWAGHRSAGQLAASAAASPSGFVRVAMPDGAAPNSGRTSTDRAVQVLNGEIPAGFPNGRSKSNPTIDEASPNFGARSRVIVCERECDMAIGAIL